ncbi:MAG: DUF1015 domain-containing protein [Spirochaetales bacterium]|nr:DUF1015 domain-containing protein [Spirochaetales bacterium]
MKSGIEGLNRVGINVANILIPNNGVDLNKWAIVACDQYTSELDYWERVERFVDGSPSTLRLIYPEIYLDEENGAERIANIQATMEEYLKQGLFDEYPESLFLIERTNVEGVSRWGLLVALDLELYDYNNDSKTPIRATEGTILDRIPPRQAIRREAPLELPHILVLLDDAERTIIEPLIDLKESLPKIYDFSLMEGGGHIRGYQIKSKALYTQLGEALAKLEKKLDPNNPLMYAMGDGNHSLATAKACWEELKESLSPVERESHPARWALVELENIYDNGLLFEPIHRILFNCSQELFLEELSRHCTLAKFEKVEGVTELKAMIEDQTLQRFGYVDSDGFKVATLECPEVSIVAGTLQHVIDALLESEQGVSVDYVHGEEITTNLGSQEGNIGLFLPAIDKHTFFNTIIEDGALPRKTFSMGEAQEKRFYLEARKIR